MYGRLCQPVRQLIRLFLRATLIPMAFATIEKMSDMALVMCSLLWMLPSGRVQCVAGSGPHRSTCVVGE